MFWNPLGSFSTTAHMHILHLTSTGHHHKHFCKVPQISRRYFSLRVKIIGHNMLTFKNKIKSEVIFIQTARRQL